MLKPRPPGTTLRRAREALHKPAPSDERFDPNHPVVLRCNDCDGFVWTIQSYVSEAMSNHRASECPRRRTVIDEPHRVDILFPRT